MCHEPFLCSWLRRGRISPWNAHAGLLCRHKSFTERMKYVETEPNSQRRQTHHEDLRFRRSRTGRDFVPSSSVSRVMPSGTTFGYYLPGQASPNMSSLRRPVCPRKCLRGDFETLAQSMAHHLSCLWITPF
jgi:hypothetical protein